MTMTDDLIDLAAKHAAAFPHDDTKSHIDFVSNYLKLIPAAPAQDAMPLDMKGDRAMPQIRRRLSRDQMFARGKGEPDVSLADLTGDDEPSFGSRIGEGLKRVGEGINKASETTERYRSGGTDQDPDNGNMDAHTLLHMIELCRNGLLSKDQENGTSESDEFLSGLADMLQAHANGNGNGVNGDRRRSARDQLPNGSANTRSPMNGIGSYGPGSSGSATGDRRRMSRDRRPAMDSAVAAINHSGFERRWGALTGHIKLSANGR